MIFLSFYESISKNRQPHRSACWRLRNRTDVESAGVRAGDRERAHAAVPERVGDHDVDGPAGRHVDGLGLRGPAQDQGNRALVGGAVAAKLRRDDAEARLERAADGLRGRRLATVDRGRVAPRLALEGERPGEAEPPIGGHVPRPAQARDDRGDRQVLCLRVGGRLRDAALDEALLRPATEHDHLERVARVEVGGPLGRPHAERNVGVDGGVPHHLVAEDLRRGGRPVYRGDGRREPAEALGEADRGPEDDRDEGQEAGDLLVHGELFSGAHAPVEMTSGTFSHF